jgi:putative endonuclease
MRSVPAVASDLRRHLGQTGETFACEHLRRLGFDIVERNYRTRWGELDIVAFDGRTLAFCEVKTRRVSGVPLEAVHGVKQNRVRKMAGQWLVERTERPRADEIRFDAIGVILDGQERLVSLEHLEGAF